MARKTGKSLTREHILETTLRILDEEGLDGLSMRRLAARLDVEAMSLYNHVQDKRDLLSGVTDLALAQIELPEAGLPWNRRLEGFALGLYEALIRHPALVLVLASEQGGPSQLEVLHGIDSMVAALAESGLSPAQQVNAFRGLLAMCLGFVLAHTQGLRKTKEQAEAGWERTKAAKACLLLAEKLRVAGNEAGTRRILEYLQKTRTDKNEKYLADLASSTLAGH